MVPTPSTENSAPATISRSAAVLAGAADAALTDVSPKGPCPHDQIFRPRRTKSTQASTLGLDQSDHSSAIVANVPAIRTERTANRGGDRDWPPALRAPRRASSWTLIRTRTPRMPQNRESGALKPQIPRSQYDW